MHQSEYKSMTADLYFEFRPSEKQMASKFFTDTNLTE